MARASDAPLQQVVTPRACGNTRRRKFVAKGRQGTRMDKTFGRSLRLVLAAVLVAVAVAIVPSAASAAVCPGGTTMIPSKSYTATHLDGTTSTGATLPATGVLPGDTVTVSFTLAPGCTKEITFATYRAPSTNGKPFENQVVYDFQTATFTEGFHANALTVKVPGITAANPGDASQCDQVAYPPGGNGANTSGAYDPTCNGS